VSGRSWASNYMPAIDEVRTRPFECLEHLKSVVGYCSGATFRNWVCYTYRYPVHASGFC
jgi:hypothetical protein